MFESFDKKGRLVTTHYDSNEDGVFERLDSVDAEGRLLSRAFDLDGDWRYERVDDFDANEKPESRGTFGTDGRSLSTEYFDSDGGLLATGSGSHVVVWKKDGRELRVVSSNDWARLGQLTVTADGGVVRRQVLTIDGWSDVTP